MAIETLERWARFDGPLQRATPFSKILGVGLGLSSIVLARTVLPLCVVPLLWLSLLAWSRLPIGRILFLAGYAFLFSAVYALVAGNFLVIVLKATGGAVVALALLTTTPYPRIFQPLQPVLPDPLPDALLLTYRSFFILGHRWEHLFTALRMRGGIHPLHPGRTAANLGASLGKLVLDAMRRSEALYTAMLLRGYRGVLTQTKSPFWNPWSWLPFAAGIVSCLSLFR